MTDFKKLCYWLAAACCLFIGHGSARADDLDSFIQRQQSAISTSNNDNRAISQREADDLIMNAMSLIGVGYRWGGTSPVTGMDCSGFMQYIFRKSMSINLPRTSAEMATVGTQVSRSALQPGDMVFFNTAGRSISHVGMYIGDNRFIHAPRKGKSIEITSLSNKYWNSKYITARRVKKHDASRFID